ncbi:carboxypeptidase A2-like [Penaeus indicus]|uniref:carboxypeptidase A2-like n=1 Tax=Penaeus indicus TaxID=29960 RepID=UPI00300C1CEE
MTRAVLLAPWLLLLAAAGSAHGDDPDGALDYGQVSDEDYPDVAEDSTLPVIKTNISEVQELVIANWLMPCNFFETGWGEALVIHDDVDAVIARLNELGVRYVYDEINVVTQMRDEDLLCAEAGCPRPLWNSFMTLSQVKYFLTDAAKNSPRVSFRAIGTTIYGREMLLAHVAPCRRQGPPNPASNPGLQRPWAVWIQAGLGANDWMTTAVALHLLRNLVDDCQASHGLHFYVMVVGNPDGYFFSRRRQMTWKKNLHFFPGSCMGVCLPFNYPFLFNIGTMGSTCHPFYRGPSPMSEVETIAIISTLKEISEKQDLMMLLDLQQPGQSIVLPFGWNLNKPEDYDAMRALALTYTEAIRVNHNVYYDVNHNGYNVGGTLIDYAKFVIGMKYSYRIFLNIDVPYLFHPMPMRDLVPQTWTGLKAMLKVLQAEKVQVARETILAFQKDQN